MSKTRLIALRFSLLPLLALALWAEPLTNPPVLVTLRLDQTSVANSGETILRAFARISPSHTNNASQIFSWNLDLISVDRENARLDPARLARSASDRDPATSSAGTLDGPDLRGIRDTFLNLPGAGRAADVELFAVPVIALAPGVARFRLLPGASGGLFDADFLVVPNDDGPPLSGADYAGALATLTITDGPSGPVLRISLAAGQQVRIEYDLPATGQYLLETKESLGGESWLPVTGGTITNNLFSVQLFASEKFRFYRARQVAP